MISENISSLVFEGRSQVHRLVMSKAVLCHSNKNVLCPSCLMSYVALEMWLVECPKELYILLYFH